MIAESHFRVLKGKFLRFLKGARLDYVLHVIAVDVNDWYCCKLEKAASARGYYATPAWETRFNKRWLEHAQDVHDNVFSGRVWRTDLALWTCECPHFIQSEALICKHLIQMYMASNPTATVFPYSSRYYYKYNI
jgi:hypothetical protein